MGINTTSSMQESWCAKATTVLWRGGGGAHSFMCNGRGGFLSLDTCGLLFLAREGPMIIVV